jgi:predicted RNA-binding Zn-ribbon protein involved in translation (DUF1610 family)
MLACGRPGRPLERAASKRGTRPPQLGRVSFGVTETGIMMNWAAQTTVVFACPKCGAIYRALQTRTSEVKTQRYACPGCKAQVHAWSGVYDYSEWTKVAKRRRRQAEVA